MLNFIKIKLNKFFKDNKEKFYEICKKIFFAIIIFFVVIACIRVVSQMIDNERNSIDKENVYKPVDTVIEGNNVKSEEFNMHNSIIETFINYCNEGNPESAYKLLTKDCKEFVYPTLEEFIENYYNKIFTEKRIYNLQSWINNEECVLYRVRILDDLISTGDYNNSNKFQDYYAIIKENEENKLSINGFIRAEEINKAEESDNIKITVCNRLIYKDHEEYEIEIKNNTDKRILLSDQSDINDNITLYQSYGKKYRASYGDLTRNDLLVRANKSKTIKLLFDLNYDESNDINKIIFSNIIKDLQLFKEYENNNSISVNEENIKKEEQKVFEEYTTITINLN